MASKIGLTYKREATTTRLQEATNKLRSRGVAVGGEVKPLRDPDAQAVQELEQTAALLEAVVARIDELQRGGAIPMGTVEVTVRDLVEHEAPGIEEIVAVGVARYLETYGPWKDNEDNAVAVGPLTEAITAAWAEAWTDKSDAETDPTDQNAGYAEHTVAELRKLLNEREINVPSDARKADLIAALEQADADAEADIEGPDTSESDAATDVEANTGANQGA
jgi:hypothetical protein